MEGILELWSFDSVLVEKLTNEEIIDKIENRKPLRYRGLATSFKTLLIFAEADLFKKNIAPPPPILTKYIHGKFKWLIYVSVQFFKQNSLMN